MFLLHQLDQTAKRIKSQLANALTLVNLCLGAFAIIFVIQNELRIALLLITIAALCDRLDGAAARKFNAVSSFGKQLDSLSDLVSFGVAPAFLIYQASLYLYGVPGMILTIFFILCGAIRLARFNVTTPSYHFVGLPITAAGCILTLQLLIVPYFPPYFFMFSILILSILMISTFKVRKV
ncbi:CDP-diacylglycerol--serine O-phosphatidyltransferase [Bacillus sp. JCM 19034]|uniref:CDP-diacylglycerol--serine O-phosphatidyltransferase n=1 Tax=Bacillus sp. JCM 19034 TaxID=1481928 RepID=UPI000784F68F|nr:CDP-diacylglycerol--serine O-phosphatidyltransferase [Bacillus sp. JCM 19034]